MKQWLRDLWRGYSEADLENALLKVVLASDRPGGLIPMSDREMRAYLALYREMQQ